jgi:hypothetical protein
MLVVLYFVVHVYNGPEKINYHFFYHKTHEYNILMDIIITWRMLQMPPWLMSYFKSQGNGMYSKMECKFQEFWLYIHFSSVYKFLFCPS